MAGEQHAVVIGASMAGLVTARVLAQRVGRVTVVDRDDLPSAPEARKGVPQGRHAHGLLPAGELVLRELFPGLLDELIDGGAQRVHAETTRWWQGGGYRVTDPDAPPATFFSRPYLEQGVRARIEALPTVTFVHGNARALMSEGGRVTGVTVETGDGPEVLAAELVVDTSGRGSQAPRWLEALGYPTPPVAEVHVDMAYASRLVRRTPGRLADGTCYVTIADVPASRRFGVAFPIEGDRWIVTLAGCHGDRPPTDDTGHLAFAESLPTPEIADLLRHEEAVTPIVAHRLPSSRWRRFDRVKRHPAGFLALGDAICSFNPIYGQGMSSAAQQAAALGRCIDDVGLGSSALPRAFYRKAKKVIANPWAIAAGGDFVFPETTGPKPAGTDLVNRYVAKAVVAAQHDPAVAHALWNVQGLLAAPPTLMRPAMVVRVLRAARRGPTGADAAVVPLPTIGGTERGPAGSNVAAG